MICKDAGLAAHQTDADQFEPKPFDHRADDVSQAAVDGSFRDQIGHGHSRNKKADPAARP
jgi:hypothetical protein